MKVQLSSKLRSTEFSPRWSRLYPIVARRSSTLPPQWSADCFSISKVLGRGNFGTVVQARWRNGKVLVALKRFSTHELRRDMDHHHRSRHSRRCRQKKSQLELIRNEVRIHSSIHHLNILPFLGYRESLTHVSLVLAWAPLGDLLAVLDQHSSGSSLLDLACTVLQNMASALEYLQRCNIAHRDIKPENILTMTMDRFCLADFGWACCDVAGDEDQRHSTLCGTAEYVAPELLHRPRWYKAIWVDCWALGVLLFEMVYGHTPFHATTSTSRHRGAGQEDTRDDGRDNDSHGIGEVRTKAMDPNEAVFTKIRAFRELPRPAACGVMRPRGCVEKDTDSMGNTTSCEGPSPDSMLQLVDDGCFHLLKVDPCDRLSPSQVLQHPLLLLKQSQSAAISRRGAPTIPIKTHCRDSTGWQEKTTI